MVVDGSDAFIDTVARVLVVDGNVILAWERLDRDPVEIVGGLEEPRDLKIKAVRFTVYYSRLIPSIARILS